MNERIREITGQVLDELVPETWTTLGYDKIKEIQRRTAELIVAECATAIINDRRLNDVRSAANGCVRTIKEHFGVKE